MPRTSSSLERFAEEIGKDIDHLSDTSILDFMDASPHPSPRGRKRKIVLSEDAPSERKASSRVSLAPGFADSAHAVKFLRHVRPSMCLSGARYVIAGLGDGSSRPVDMASSSVPKLAKEVDFVRRDKTRNTALVTGKRYFASVHIPKKFISEARKCEDRDKIMIFDVIIVKKSSRRSSTIQAAGIIVKSKPSDLKFIYFSPENVSTDMAAIINRAFKKAIREEFIPASSVALVAPHIFKGDDKKTKFIRMVYVILTLITYPGTSFGHASTMGKNAPIHAIRSLTEQYMEVVGP
jgi:hypothetical protein